MPLVATDPCQIGGAGASGSTPTRSTQFLEGSRISVRRTALLMRAIFYEVVLVQLPRLPLWLDGATENHHSLLTSSSGSNSSRAAIYHGSATFDYGQEGTTRMMKYEDQTLCAFAPLRELFPQTTITASTQNDLTPRRKARKGDHSIRVYSCLFV